MLKFIGTGSAFNKDLGNTSAYIKENETLLLIDCGQTVFTRMQEINLLDDVKKVYIIIYTIVRMRMTSKIYHLTIIIISM